MKRIMFILVGIFLISLVSAFSNSSLYNGTNYLKSENITFFDNFNVDIERSWSYINVSSGSNFNDPSNAVDENWATSSDVDVAGGTTFDYIAEIYENFTVPYKNDIKANWSFEYYTFKENTCQSNFNVTCFNGNSWILMFSDNSSYVASQYRNVTINSSCLNQDILSIKTTINTKDSDAGTGCDGDELIYSEYYEGKVYWEKNYTRYLRIPENTILTEVYLNLSGYSLRNGLTNFSKIPNGLNETNGSNPTELCNDYGFCVFGENLKDQFGDCLAPLTNLGGIQVNSTNNSLIICDSGSPYDPRWYKKIYPPADEVYNITFEIYLDNSIATIPFVIGDEESLNLTGNSFNNNHFIGCTYQSAASESCINGSSTVTFSNSTGKWTFEIDPLNRQYDFYINGLIVLSNLEFPYNMNENIRYFGDNGGGTNQGRYRIFPVLNITSYIKEQSNITNASIKLNDLALWEFADDFIQTNNKTTNLASYINNFLNSTYLAGSNYLIPLIFNSDTLGILEYLGLIFNNNGFLENSQTYNSTTLSNNVEKFTINITYDSNYYSSVIGSLIYNNTFYTGTVTQSGDDTLISKTITIPSINSSVVNDFYWQINLTNSSGTFSFNSSNYTQTINPVLIGLCNTTLNVSFVNFSVLDSDNSNVLNASFKISINLGSQSFTYSDTSQTNNSFAFCFSPSDDSYIISSNIEYESTNYAKNFYYLTNYTLSNSTQNITLYLLNDSKATATQITVKDSSQLPISNSIIQIQKYDSGTDTYYTIGMARTDDNGEDVVYLNWYDTFYKYIVSKNNQILYTSGASKIYDSPVSLVIPDTINLTYTKFEDITYTLTYNNITKNFVFTFSKPDGSVTSVCMEVIKRNIRNDTIICNTCETSSSATIYCNIGSSGNGTFIARVYGLGSLGYIDSLVELVNVSEEIYEQIGNLDGSIYAFLFGGIILVMFAVTPVLAVIGIILAIIGSMAMGFQPINYLELIGIIIVGGVIIIILKR